MAANRVSAQEATTMEMNRSEHQWLSRLETNRSGLAALIRSVQTAGQATAAGSPEGPTKRNYETATSIIDRVSTEAMLRLLAENREQVERALERLRRTIRLLRGLRSADPRGAVALPPGGDPLRRLPVEA
jgi:hypothetical protein